MSTIKKFKWFWAWDDEKEETWLTEMSRNGHHLKSIGFPGVYTFDNGAKTNYIYRLDFNTNRKGYREYFRLFQDAGWEHVGEFGSWQYFRTEADAGEKPEIFTDNQSKGKKYGRILLFLIIFMPIYIFLLTRVNQASSTFYKIIMFVMFLFFLLYMYAMLMLIRRISQLKKKP